MVLDGNCHLAIGPQELRRSRTRSHLYSATGQSPSARASNLPKDMVARRNDSGWTVGPSDDDVHESVVRRVPSGPVCVRIIYSKGAMIDFDAARLRTAVRGGL